MELFNCMGFVNIKKKIKSGVCQASCRLCCNFAAHPPHDSLASTGPNGKLMLQNLAYHVTEIDINK